MKVGVAARQLVGFLPQHADAFGEVAQANNCIIMCRAPGVFAPGLISEGYASKGFHNKAKSCNWGPMAGFVCMEPRFSKAGLTPKGVKKQTTSVHKAILEGATPVQVFLSDVRLNWLTKLGYIKRLPPGKLGSGKKGSRVWQYQATMKGCKGDYVEAASGYTFTMKETQVNGTNLWGAYFQPTSKSPLRPVKALRDPNWSDLEVRQGVSGVQYQVQQGVVRDDMPLYKKATTGDHDLFAVWGPNGLPQDVYARPVDSSDMSSGIDLDLKEDPDQGNISQYVSQVATLLNQAIRRVRWGDAKFAYSGGDMVHHSDEAARPFIDDVDLPFIAFFPPGVCDLPQAPGKTVVAFETVAEFRQLIDAAIKWDYHIELNPGWIDELSEGKGVLKRKYKKYVVKGRKYQGIL